jgi:hypothetical protein
LDPLDLGRWRGQVKASIRGKRGQAFLKELLAALDAMPKKRLVRGEFEADGEVCALGCMAKARGMDASQFDPDDAEEVGDAFGVANQLTREIMYENDEFIVWDNTFGRQADSPEKRWTHMRKWVADQITATSLSAGTEP